MKSIRIGNDIRIEWPIVLSGDVSKLQDLDLTVEVRPSAKIIDTHNYADEIRNNDNKRLLFEKHETTVMMNGGLECRRDIGDGKEHCRPRPPRPCPPRPIPPAPVKLPYHIEDNTLIAMWTADRQFATGDYDIILYAHKNEGGQAVCDQYRFVRLVSHTAQADAPDDSGIEAVIAMQPVTLELSGLSAYEVAVINGFQGTEEEWLASLKKPAEDAAEELKQEIEQFKEDTKEELQADIKALGYYEDNPEFIRVYTDAEGKFLWGIRIDGSIEWAKGVPTPIKAALKELADKIKDLGGDKIEEVETALNEKIEALQDAIDVINASLKTLTDTFSYQDNPEFVNVVTDADGKVLFGIKADGKPFFPKNEVYSVESNQEFLAAWLDAAGHVLFGLRQDGSTYVAKADFLTKIEEITKLLDENSIKDEEIAAQVKQLQDTFSIVSNDEWLHAVVDAEGKLLFGIKAENGEVVMPKQDMYKVVKNDEWLAAWLDSQDRILFGVKADGTFWAAKSNFAGGGNYDEQIAELNEEIQQVKDQIEATASDVFSVIDDAEERLAVTTDKDERVISYRDKDGVLHENKGIDTSKYYLNGEEKKFVDNLTDLEGVSDHNTPNLLVASEMQKTFNDGTNSFTPPNAGYEMSNPIECQAGDWFTRTGTATGMVVVTDENDKNGTRLFNTDGTTLGSTFQIPEDMTWVRYIRMAAEVNGANDGTVVICKGKKAYIGDNMGDFVTFDKFRLQENNIPKNIKYLQTSDGRYWELYVNETDFTLKIREIDPDIITNLPSDFKPWTLTGTFDGKFDRMCIPNNNYLIEIKASGVVKYKYVGNIVNGNYSNFEHFYQAGVDRYGFMFLDSENTIGKKFTLFDENLNIIDTNIGRDGYNTTTADLHDFIYIDDRHILLFHGIGGEINVPGYGSAITISGFRITELKKGDNAWSVVGSFNSLDYPQLETDAFGDLGNVVDAHINTLGLDYDNNIIVNCRNWDCWIKIKRTENSDGTVIIGSKTLDYDEAIIGRVGGRHNSAYIDSKRVLNDGFSFTDTPASLTEVSDDAWEEWQWFHCHDVKYWGMKQINGKQYPTYTLFDNNYWTRNTFLSGQYNVINKNNNKSINSQGDGAYYSSSKDGDSNYAQYTHSRVIQVSIDWENHKIIDYRVYYIPKMYTQQAGGATMYDEGIISISYAQAGEFGLWDFTTGETEVSGHVYKGAKQLFLGKYDTQVSTYRVNTYKLNV